MGKEMVKTEDVTAVFQNGVSLFESRDFPGALPVFELVAQVSPGIWGLYYYLGYTYMSLSRFPEAIYSFELALAQDPQNLPACLNKGFCYEAQGCWDRAEESYRNGLKIESENPDVHFGLANVHAGRKDWNAAAAEFQVALELNPEHCESLTNLAAIYFHHRNDDKKAAQLLETALKSNPGNEVVLENLHEVYEFQGEFRLRDRILRELKKISPKHHLFQPPCAYMA